MAAYIGSKVEVHTTDGIYTGILHVVEEKQGRLTLDKVVSKKTGKLLPGVQHYFPRELRHVLLLEEKKDSQSKVVKTDGTNDGSKSLLRKKDTPAHLKKLKSLDRQRMYQPIQNKLLDSSEEENARRRLETSHGEMPCKLPHLSSMKYKILYNTGLDFRKVVDLVLKHKLIGVAAEGSCLGRNGTLLWMQISLHSECFLFDMKTIGVEAALSSGLQDVLESPNVQKVIHNCRKLSDYLHHKHHIEMVNVFDTQVADVLVYQNQHLGDLPRFVHSISQLVPTFVDLELADIHKARARAALQEQDEMSFWGGARPPAEQVVQTAMFNVQYLLTLHYKLLDKLMEPLRTGVDVFLSALRDAPADQYQARVEQTNHLVPNEFADLARYSHERSRFVNNEHNLPDPMIVFSHDAVQHVADPTFDRRMDALRRGRAKTASDKSTPRSRSKSLDAHRSSSTSPVTTPDGDSLMALGASHLSRQQGSKPLISDVPPKTVKENVERVLSQTFVPTPGCKPKSAVTANGIDNDKVLAEDPAAASTMQTGKRRSMVCKAAGAESSYGQFPLNERTTFTKPAKKVDDGEEYGNIPDHQKFFPNELKGRPVDWDCLNGRACEGEEQSEGGAGAKEPPVTAAAALNGYASDSVLGTVTNSIQQPLSPTATAGSPPVKGLGRGQIILRAINASAAGAGNQAAPTVKVPKGRAAVLQAYGNLHSNGISSN